MRSKLHFCEKRATTQGRPYLHMPQAHIILQAGEHSSAPTVLPIITAVFTERLNYSNLIIGSVGNAVPGVPWDLMCFHGQPQGLSLRFFSICSGRCPHRPKVIYYIIRLRRIGSSRTANPTDMSLICSLLSGRPHRVAPTSFHHSPLPCRRWFLLFCRNVGAFPA